RFSPRPPRSTLFPYPTLFRSGLDGAGLPLDSIEAFDQSTQTWSLAGSLLSPRGEHQALDVGQWVYLIGGAPNVERGKPTQGIWRSEEHTSELQSRENLVCRLL